MASSAPSSSALQSPFTLSTGPNFTNFSQYNGQQDISYPDFSQIRIVRMTFVALFLVECVLGVLGNLLVCLTVYRNKSMHSSVNYYIVNLGACDFIIAAFVLPIKLFQLTAETSMNVMNDIWCTSVRFLETVVVFTSVFTLVAICMERYYAVVYPVHSRVNLTDRRVPRVLLAVWMVPIIVSAPNLQAAEAEPGQYSSDFGKITRLVCFDSFSDDFRRGYFIFLFVFLYLIPLIFIGVTCFSITRVLIRKIPVQPRRDPRAIALEKGRRKVAKMVLVIVFAFIFCWTPYFMVTIVTQLQTENFLQHGQYFFTMLCINLLCFTNSCINPFVYFAMSARFRKGLMSVMRSLTCQRRRNRFSQMSSMSSGRINTSHRKCNGGGNNGSGNQVHYHGSHHHHTRFCNHGELPCTINVGNRSRSSSSSGAGGGDTRPMSSRHCQLSTHTTPGNIKDRRALHRGLKKGARHQRLQLQINDGHSPLCCSQLIPLSELSQTLSDYSDHSLTFEFEESTTSTTRI